MAYQRKKDIAANLKNMIQIHLDQGMYTAIATHDETIIDWVKQYAQRHRISKDNFEFQMLYGLRMRDQIQLAKEGYRIRCYVPYGAKWYPYFTRRLAEKPSHVWMVFKHMFH